jgi:hypothetical protein
MTNIELIVRVWEDRKERILNNFHEWTPKLLADPDYELAWSDALFDEAAELKYIKMYLPWFKGEVNPDFAGDRLEQAILELSRDLDSKARSRASSTSATSNRMEDARRVALAKMVEFLKGAAQRRTE